jgi:hypothetical protein
MTYRIKGHVVDLTLSASEIGDIIASLQLSDPHGELLAAFKEYQAREFAGEVKG